VFPGTPFLMPLPFFLCFIFAAMKSKIIAVLAVWVLLLSCSNGEAGTPESENDIDAARNFINAALKGHWKEARSLAVKDSVNMQLLDVAENNYSLHMNREEKRGYNEASINILDTRVVDSATSVVRYSNSFKKKEDSLKIVKLNNEWLVDLKYSFPQTDTTIYAQ
jgi:hypothetical protein